jgi:hypothetical protein
MQIKTPFKKWLFAKLRIGIFTPSIPSKINKRILFVENTILHRNSNRKDLNLFIYDKWESDLRRCYKFGGYKKFISKYYWSHRKLQYFDFEKKIYGGIPQIISKSQIAYIEKIKYFPNAINPNNVSKYTFKIQKNSSSKYDIDKALSFNLGGIEYFQHFVQDCLPIIAASTKFLSENQDVSILLPKFDNNFSDWKYFLNLLEIKNTVIETSNKPIHINKLFFWNFEPYPAKYDLPPEWYSNVYNKISATTASDLAESIVLITREEKQRNFGNPVEVATYLRKLAQNLEMKFDLIDSKAANLLDYKAVLPRARVVIAMHGGANFNLIFANPDCIFFELIPTHNSNSLINFMGNTPIKYVPVPIQSRFDDQFMNVGIEKLDDISKIICKFMNET